MHLVIVESPAKARTISKFLGKKYRVKASMGHLVDLPKSQLGIDPQNNFKPKYITIRGKGKILTELKDIAKKAEQIYLATDPDREGEAISWHLSNSLGIKDDEPCRVEFNEITKNAVVNAFSKPRFINENKFEAQQARRILDRLVGYMISPLLWDKVRKGLSAGRVQSVALRLICDREQEIEAFVREEYWSIDANLETPEGENTFIAKFYGQAGAKVDLKNEEQVKAIINNLEGKDYTVEKLQVQERKRNPAAPFTTSTLQQEASKRLGFTTKKTMMIAQQLYEGIEVGKKGEPVGLITYMRTDSTKVSVLAQEEARSFILDKYGDNYLPPKPRLFSAKKGAQEAHEAIRPTSIIREPELIKKYLNRDQFRLYSLIWHRFLASQMEAALIELVKAEIKAGDYLFRASGSTIKFPGFMIIYKVFEDEEKEKEDEKQLPPLEEGQLLKFLSLKPNQHFTQPPPRYTEASLVKAMESNGIGRPSTYSPTIETVQGRGYVVREEKAFKPTELGFIVVNLMKNYFPEIIDVDFTAQLEDKLDKVETGELSWQMVLNNFYDPFLKRLKVAEKEMEKVNIINEVTEEVCPSCGKNLVKKFGRYGEFYACPGFPECRYTMQPKVYTGVKCPLCGGDVVERKSKKGRKFFGCSNYPDCKFVSSYKPVDKYCPECNNFLVEKKSRGSDLSYRCSNKECTYEEKNAVKSKSN